ncbi:MAG: tetratricopeptide repeat protein [Spirochaetes bacterium]|nr:tetratricopeptide repeat protein [Spirochaetota bacterium]
MEKRYKKIIRCSLNIKFYFFLFFYLLLIKFNIFSDQTNDLLKNALIYENNGNYDKALEYYQKYIKVNNDEKVFLKIIRLTQDYDEIVQKYNDFLIEFPVSRFRFIARYELAKIYLLNNNYKEALKEFEKLKEFSRGNQYYYRSSYNIANIHNKLKNYHEAIIEIDNLLSDDENIYNKAECFYLSAIINIKNGNYKEAEKNLLFCIDNYSSSDIVASCLFELITIYMKMNDIDNVNYYSDKLNKGFPDSFENYIIKKKLKNNNTNDNELIYYNENELINDNRIRSDLKLSLEIDSSNELINLKSYYLQLSYLSNYENAKILLDSYRLKGLNDIFISRTESASSNKIFYRLLIGPYFNLKDAKKRKEELDSKKIDSIIMELVKSYE